jgi:hypothetical protein
VAACARPLVEYLDQTQKCGQACARHNQGSTRTINKLQRGVVDQAAASNVAT